jgi:hypothetical protein
LRGRKRGNLEGGERRRSEEDKQVAVLDVTLPELASLEFPLLCNCRAYYEE